MFWRIILYITSTNLATQFSHFICDKSEIMKKKLTGKPDKMGFKMERNNFWSSIFISMQIRFLRKVQAYCHIQRYPVMMLCCLISWWHNLCPCQVFNQLILRCGQVNGQLVTCFIFVWSCHIAPFISLASLVWSHHEHRIPSKIILPHFVLHRPWPWPVDLKIKTRQFMQEY